MKAHHPWWPHIDRDPIFNPFVPVTDRRPASDRIEVSDAEEEEDGETAAEQPAERSPADK